MAPNCGCSVTSEPRKTLGQSLHVDEKGMVRLELKLIPESKMPLGAA